MSHGPRPIGLVVGASFLKAGRCMIARALVLSPNRSYAHEFRTQLQAQLASGIIVDVETNPMRAMQLAAGEYELILLDGELGIFDGMQMMLMLKGHAPGASFVMVYDAVSDLERMQAMQTGARLVLSRPADDAGWVKAMEQLRPVVMPTEASVGVDEASGDDDSDIPLREMIATECLSGNSTYIEAIRHDGTIGDIFVYQGDVYHAQCPGASATSAVQEVLAWAEEGVKIKTRDLQHIPPRTIDTGWRELLDMPQEPPEPEVTEAPVETTQPNEVAAEAPAFRTGELPKISETGSMAQKGIAATHLTSTGSLIQPDEAFVSEAMSSYWNIDLNGRLLGGKNIENADDAARLTYHVYRLMAEASVALEIDYFDRLTLFGPRVQQELAADNLGVSHAVFDAEAASQHERDEFVKWCYGKEL